jgi:hypothetical protein
LRLEGKLIEILGGEIPILQAGKRRRKISAAACAKIGAAQRARWAKAKGKRVEKSTKPKRKMSAATRVAMAAAAKARWEKARVAGKTRL